MEIIERVLERRIREFVNIDSMQFGFMPGRGTTDALFVVRRIQEKYSASSIIRSSWDNTFKKLNG